MCIAVPARIARVEVDAEGVRWARLADATEDAPRVCLSCVPDAAPGDYVIVHLGLAIRLLSPADAADLLALLASASAAGPGRLGLEGGDVGGAPVE